MKLHKIARQFRNGSCILLSALFLLSCLSGCQSETINPAPEDMAAALLALTLHDDLSALQELFHYEDEAAIYEDFETLSENMGKGFQVFAQKYSTVIGKLPDGVIVPWQYFESATPVMLSKLTVTPELTTLENDRAVLIFHSQAYDSEPYMNGLTAWMIAAVSSVLPAFDPDFSDNMNGVNGLEKQVKAQQLFYNTEYAFMVELLKSMDPSGDAVKFTAVFVPTEMTVNGRRQTIWLPEDPETFGTAIIDATFEGIV